MLALAVLAGCGIDSAERERAQRALNKVRIELTVAPQTGKSRFEVVGLHAAELNRFPLLSPEMQAEVLRLRVAQPDDAPFMTGEVGREDRVIYFAPRFPLTPGVEYRVVFDRRSIAGEGAAIDAPLHMDFTLQKAKVAPTAVERIYPSSDELVENQLRFYIHFSAPMARANAYRHLRLLDGEGNTVEAPFLELGEELWDDQQRRFTLLFDPGRVKRGLKPREEVGPVLREGEGYTLVIDRDWLDAAGEPLAAEARKTFRVLPPREVQLDPADWKVTAPRAESREPLVVRFPNPLDHSMLQRVVAVAKENGESVAGTIEITDRETCWQFTPQQPWAAGNYKLVASVDLEDPAGNSLGRAFDVDVFNTVQRTIANDHVALPFAIKPE